MSPERTEQLPDPPKAPDIRRGVSFHTFQWVMIPLLAALPLLALSGVFGERWRTETAAAGPLEITVHYPTAFRYKMINTLTATVTNRSGTVLDTVTVSLDSAYANRFSTVTAIPPFTAAHDVEVVALAPAESRLVRIEMQGERYWRHEGFVRVISGTDTASVAVSTIVFP